MNIFTKQFILAYNLFCRLNLRYGNFILLPMPEFVNENCIYLELNINFYYININFIIN